MQRHPQVQWVIFQAGPRGIDVRCEVCGAAAGSLNPAGLHQFAGAHRQHVSRATGHYGAGDMVARATKALGMETCTPCEKRRMMLNGMMPRVWRR
jgi:hypothetical protein